MLHSGRLRNSTPICGYESKVNGIDNAFRASMKINVHTNLMRYGGIECVKSIKLQDNRMKIAP